MARNLKSANSGNPTTFVSGGHATSITRQTRLIRLSRPANDNRAPHRHRVIWLMMMATIAVAIALSIMA